MQMYKPLFKFLRLKWRPIHSNKKKKKTRDILTLWYEPVEGGGLTSSSSLGNPQEHMSTKSLCWGSVKESLDKLRSLHLESTVQKVILDMHDYLYSS